jgi:hypothetical protein
MSVRPRPYSISSKKSKEKPVEQSNPKLQAASYFETLEVARLVEEELHRYG